MKNYNVPKKISPGRAWEPAPTMVVILSFCLSGCMLATQKDMIDLDSNLTQMRKNQADLVTKMLDLSGNLENLNSQLESSQQRMTTLSQKIDDLQADITRRMNVLSGQVTGTSSGGTASGSSANPGEMFRLAQNDYQAGKFDLALIEFRNLLTQFPHAELASQAQYQIGECEFARKNYNDAAREYEKVVAQYPKSDAAPKALLKKGIAFQSGGKPGEARETFRRVIKDFPHHEVARSAKELLKSE
jgi:tol-pal system protein YbgF